MKSCQGRERVAWCRACRSFWSPFFPPLFLALGLFPFALSRNSFCSHVSRIPMCALLPSPSAAPPWQSNPPQHHLFQWVLFPEIVTHEMTRIIRIFWCWGGLDCQGGAALGEGNKAHMGIRPAQRFVVRWIQLKGRTKKFSRIVVEI